ncbi:c-type cytochrome [Herbaspirillum robiniae]|uniref:c-type cytochrome n=1 Tax=Herbaspirillum robiniae TaxID=2014887 RepID=UPI003D77D914
MKLHRIVPSLFTLSALLLPAAGMAASSSEESCRVCHKIDSKLVGPAFMDVAARYAKDKDAIAKLKRSMLQGSSGKWGTVAMPPNAGLSEAEAERFAHWIMSLNKPAAKK